MSRPWLGTGDVVEIEDLFVEPGRMRQGIGRALVLALIRTGRLSQTFTG